MKLITDTVRRALEYVRLLNREGYLPTSQELDNFITTPAPLEARYSQGLAMAIGLSSASTFGKNIRADGVSRYALAMGWLDPQERGLKLSGGGEAILRAVARGNSSDGDAITVTLAPEDPLVYEKLSKLLAEAGEDVLLADGYFKAELLPFLAVQTNVRRILINGGHPGAAKQRLSICNVLAAVTDAKFEVRATRDSRLHDRCLIPKTGPVTLMGNSMSSVGQTLTVAAPIQDEPSEAYRTLYGELWNKADVLIPQTPTGRPAPKPKRIAKQPIATE